jgi:hypothetical protein
MLASGKQVGPPQQIEIRLRVITRYVLDNFFNANHLCLAGRMNRPACLQLETINGNVEYNKKVIPDPKVEHHLWRANNANYLTSLLERLPSWLPLLPSSFG